MRRVGFGILGAGRIARVALAPAMAGCAEVDLVAGSSRERSRALALGATRAYDDHDAVLADRDVEAVYVALSNELHLRWAHAALAAGKHVLCEKPLALDVAEVDRLIAAADARGVLLAEASFYQWHPRTVRTRELLAGGAIGTVEHVEGGFCFTGTFPPGDHRLDPARGGGAAYDVGCYPVSAALWALDQPIAAVAARSSYGPTGVDMSTDLLLDAAGGGTAALSCSFADDRGQWLRITGSRGEIGWAAGTFLTVDTPTVLELSQGTGTERLPFAACNPYALMVRDFARAVRGKPSWTVPLGQSRAVAAVLDAARASAAEGGAAVLVAEVPARHGVA